MNFGRMGAGFGQMGALRRGGYNPVVALSTDLIAYWEAERSDKITATANAVSSWLDLKGGYAATGAAQPTYSATGFNGRPVVTADGVDDCLTCTDAGLLAALPSGANPGELWVLCSQTALAADTTVRMAVDYGNGANVGRRIRRSVVSGVNRASAQVGTGAAAVTAQGTVADLSSRHVIRAQFTATEVILTVDGGTAITTAAVPSTTVSRLRLFAGSAGTAANFWEGGIAAMLCTLPLSTAKATALQSYLLGRRML